VATSQGVRNFEWYLTVNYSPTIYWVSQVDIFPSIRSRMPGVCQPCGVILGMPVRLFHLIPAFTYLVFYAFVCRWPSIVLFTRANCRGGLHNMIAITAACAAPDPATPSALRPSQHTQQTRQTYASRSTHAPGLFAPPQKVTAAPRRSSQRAARAAVPPTNPRPPAPPTPTTHATNSAPHTRWEF
jgi:hypothetical protein